MSQKTVNSTVNCRIRWCVYANDTDNNWNATSCANPFSYNTTAPADITPPQWSNNYTNPSSGSAYSPNKQYQFIVTWVDPESDVSSVLIEYNFTGVLSNYSGLTNVTSTWYYTYYDLPVGKYVWREYAVNTKDLMNSTHQWVFEVKKAATEIRLYLNDSLWTQDKDFMYPNATKINTTINASNLQSFVVFERNKTVVSNPEEILLGVGVYNYTGSFAGNSNYTSSYYTRFLTISLGYSEIWLYLNGTRGNMEMMKNEFLNTTAFLNKPSIGFLEIWSNYSNGQWKKWADGYSPVQNLTNMTTGGIWGFKANFSNVNYTPAEESWTVNVIVNRPPQIWNLFIRNLNDDIITETATGIARLITVNASDLDGNLDYVKANFTWPNGTMVYQNLTNVVNKPYTYSWTYVLPYEMPYSLPNATITVTAYDTAGASNKTNTTLWKKDCF